MKKWDTHVMQCPFDLGNYGYNPLRRKKRSESCSVMSVSLQPHGLLQARILEWVAVPFSRASSQTRDWTQISRITGGFFTSWATREVQLIESACVHAKSLQLCLTLCDPMDCSPPGSSVHGILQARILERVVISFSRGSSRPRDRDCESCTGRWVHYH